MVLAMSSEAAAVSILVRNWVPGIPIALLGGAVIITVTLLNLLGASKLGGLESGLAAIKLLAIVSFIIIAVLLISGLMPGTAAAGAGELTSEPFMPAGFKGLAGSMLVVMFTYAGFEIIGLASSEAENPRVTVPKGSRADRSSFPVSEPVT
jgi:L-asparagine transporter-like permease